MIAKVNVTLIKPMTMAVMLIPATFFIWIAIHYSLNIPLYDEITQILWIVNTFLEGHTNAGTPEHIYPVANRLHALFYPNASHIPMVTRLISLSVFYTTGSIHFAVTAVMACLIWVGTVFFLLYQANKQGITLFMLLPLPFLLFSLSQWESMTMTLGGMQMYLGTLFLPILTLYALTKKQTVFASIAFFFALFDSGGALSLLPLGIAYLLLQRAWLQTAGFLLLCGLSSMLFLHLNVFLNSGASAPLSNIPEKIEIALQFMGNVIGEGAYVSDSVHSTRLISGSALVFLSLLSILFCPGQHLTKLIIVYVYILAVMTSMNRADIVSRYSVFAMLALGSTYLLLIDWLKNRHYKSALYASAIATLLAIGLWTAGLMTAITPLESYYSMRINDMQNYLQTGNASMLMWDPAWCTDILNESKRLGVYDYTQSVPNK